MRLQSLFCGSRTLQDPSGSPSGASLCLLFLHKSNCCLWALLCSDNPRACCAVGATPVVGAAYIAGAAPLPAFYVLVIRVKTLFKHFCLSGCPWVAGTPPAWVIALQPLTGSSAITSLYLFGGTHRGILFCCGSGGRLTVQGGWPQACTRAQCHSQLRGQHNCLSLWIGYVERLAF